ncbi:glycosyltransferase [Spirosoma validum]|uniref:Glycosyltransferase n=1 Tax=Spirosoma validum TaxID=2771355 RepID=A0A927B6Q0_9BACT|nr:glycosyltransferase [Spirosoma validum]MBD2756227.1 glycosyltransferase [Spirosoma validum]
MKAESILCIGQTPWKGDFQRPAVQLLTELALHYNVLYVDYQYTAKDAAMHFLGGKKVPMQKILRTSGDLESLRLANGEEIHIWTPPVMMPVNSMPEGLHDTFLTVNIQRLLKGLLPVMQQLGIQNPIVINAFHPVYGLALIGKLGEGANIYYCFDEITAEPWMARHGTRYEPEYLRRVDAVVTTSETLRIAKSRLQPNSYTVKNGANFDLFRQTYELRKSRDVTHKTVGYLGTADNRLDLDLIEHCVQRMPEVRFQFLGPVNHPSLVPRLGQYLNVEFISPKEPHELPDYLARMHVGMIPFVRNEHTYTIYPLKINEYLAAGMPVVSTEFSMLDDFTGVVRLANTPEQFAEGLQAALNENDPDLTKRRIDMAEANSWAHRAQEFEQVIKKTLNRRVGQEALASLE